MVAVGGVSGYLARPEGDAHHGVGASYHQKRQEVDQDGHAEVIPGTDDGCWVCSLPVQASSELGGKVSHRVKENLAQFLQIRRLWSLGWEGFPTFTSVIFSAASLWHPNTFLGRDSEECVFPSSGKDV